LMACRKRQPEHVYSLLTRCIAQNKDDVELCVDESQS